MRAPHRWKYESDFHQKRSDRQKAVLTLGFNGMESAGIVLPSGKQSSFCSLFTALEALIGPHVSPVPVPPAVGDTEFIEIAMNRGQSRGSIEIEDHVGVAQEHRLATEHAVVFAEKTAATQIPDYRLNAVFR